MAEGEIVTHAVAGRDAVVVHPAKFALTLLPTLVHVLSPGCEVEKRMWQGKKVARPRCMRAWLTAIAMVPALGLGLSACDKSPAPPQRPQVITDKGTPYGDLLVPKLTASVKDGAVGVTVDSPVIVSAEDGVLGAVTMAQRTRPPGRRSPQPRRSDVAHARAAGLQQALHAERTVAWPR